MTKNGLFVVSLGLLFFVYSADQNKGQYDLLLMATALTFIAFGSYLVYQGSKKNKGKKDK